MHMNSHAAQSQYMTTPVHLIELSESAYFQFQYCKQAKLRIASSCDTFTEVSLELSMGKKKKKFSLFSFFRKNLVCM